MYGVLSTACTKQVYLSMKRFISSTTLVRICTYRNAMNLKEKKGNSNRSGFLAPALCTCVLQLKKKTKHKQYTGKTTECQRNLEAYSSV